MSIRIANDHGQATLYLGGRLDTTVARQTEEEINEGLRGTGVTDSLTIDASELTYISSSGLRIILSLAKNYNLSSIINVQPEIYEVMKITGFTRMMHIEKGLRHVSVDGCEVIGMGGVGTVYRINDDTIIKVFREGTTLAEVEKEVNMSKEAFVMGTPTAISFDVVNVGNRLGLVYELLYAETLSTQVRNHPEQLDLFAQKYADLLHQLHDIEVPKDSCIPSGIENERKAIQHISHYFPQEGIDIIMQILDAIPEGNRLLHLDLQAKNIMIQGSEPMLIDMGEVGYGHPLLDLGHTHSSMETLIGDYEQIIGIPKQLGIELWHRTLDYYFKGESPQTIEHRKKQLDVVACIRNISWLALSDSFPESVIRECQLTFTERVMKRRDYLLQVSETFKDWK